MLLLDSAVFDAVIDWMANGIMGFSGWQIFFVILGLTHITIASVTIFLHGTRRTGPWICTPLHRIFSAFGCG